LVRESFRHHQQSLRGLDCVVLAKSRIVQVDNSQQVAWMERSGIQESATLDYATLHPGYVRYAALPLS